MINLKEWSLKHLTDMLLVTFVTALLVTIFHLVISPLLVTVLPTVFVAKLTLTDTLLFILLVVMLGRK
jgi:hypothetical protein